MNNFYQKLPILLDDGFIYLSKIFNKYHVNLYAVGGCIRDSFLLETMDILETDIDLSVPIPPQQIIEILNTEKVKYFTIGIEFGTVTAHYKNKNYEITSFRQDIITDGRHAAVVYTTDMILDSQRRDFTINALYYDNQGIVYDPLGHGITDLKQKKISFIGNPQTRIHEDYLRILRYFRFCSRFGMTFYQADIFKQNDYSDGLKILSEHRISHELKKMIVYPFASNALSEIIKLQYDKILFKELCLNVTLFQQFKNINPYSECLLASLLFQTDFQNIKKTILLSKQDKKKINDFAKLYKNLQCYLDMQEWYCILELQYDFNIIIWHDVLCLLQLDYLHLEKKIKVLKKIILPLFTVTGKELIIQGYKQGKEIASILKQKRIECIKKFVGEAFNS